MTAKLRRFSLIRDIDVTGISGTGAIAHGVQFWDGVCVMKWDTQVSSLAGYASMADLIDIHGHNGSTRVEWID
jgi:hypothetical protein